MKKYVWRVGLYADNKLVSKELFASRAAARYYFNNYTVDCEKAECILMLHRFGYCVEKGKYELVAVENSKTPEVEIEEQCCICSKKEVQEYLNYCRTSFFYASIGETKVKPRYFQELISLLEAILREIEAHYRQGSKVPFQRMTSRILALEKRNAYMLVEEEKETYETIKIKL